MQFVASNQYYHQSAAAEHLTSGGAQAAAAVAAVAANQSPAAMGYHHSHAQMAQLAAASYNQHHQHNQLKAEAPDQAAFGQSQSLYGEMGAFGQPTAASGGGGEAMVAAGASPSLQQYGHLGHHGAHLGAASMNHHASHHHHQQQQEQHLQPHQANHQHVNLNHNHNHNHSHHNSNHNHHHPQHPHHEAQFHHHHYPQQAQQPPMGQHHAQLGLHEHHQQQQHHLLGQQQQHHHHHHQHPHAGYLPSNHQVYQQHQQQAQVYQAPDSVLGGASPASVQPATPKVGAAGAFEGAEQQQLLGQPASGSPSATGAAAGATTSPSGYLALGVAGSPDKSPGIDGLPAAGFMVHSQAVDVWSHQMVGHPLAMTQQQQLHHHPQHHNHMQHQHQPQQQQQQQQQAQQQIQAQQMPLTEVGGRAPAAATGGRRARQPAKRTRNKPTKREQQQAALSNGYEPIKSVEGAPICKADPQQHPVELLEGHEQELEREQQRLRGRAPSGDHRDHDAARDEREREGDENENDIEAEHEDDDDDDDDDDDEDSLSHGSERRHIFPWMRRGQNAQGGSGSSYSVDQKRQRTAYTKHQLFNLEQEFHTTRYLSRRKRIEIAHNLSLTERQIKIWFQNRRMKFKKDNNLPNTKNVKKRNQPATSTAAASTATTATTTTTTTTSPTSTSTSTSTSTPTPAPTGAATTTATATTTPTTKSGASTAKHEPPIGAQTSPAHPTASGAGAHTPPAAISSKASSAGSSSPGSALGRAAQLSNGLHGHAPLNSGTSNNYQQHQQQHNHMSNHNHSQPQLPGPQHLGGHALAHGHHAGEYALGHMAPMGHPLDAMGQLSHGGHVNGDD